MSKNKKLEYKENYGTVLERIYIRAEFGSPPRWQTVSIRELLEKDQKQLKEWLRKYIARAIVGITEDGELKASELIEIIKWMDNVGINPVRLKEGAFNDD